MQENQNLENKTTDAEVAESNGQAENLAEPVADSPTLAEVEENAEIVEPTTEPPMIETAESEQKQSQPAELQDQKVEEILQAENLSPVEIQEVENAKAQTPDQEIPAQPQTKIVEQIVYKTDPNFIQKLLIKARAKIQERKRKKLDKIMSLFETKSQIKSENVRKLLFIKKRTATNYLNQLEKEQRIIQIGKKGNEVFYVKKL